MAKKLMEKPSPHPYYHTTYEDHNYNLMKGSKIIDMFYDQGIWKENYIPKELEEAGWRPDKDKLYRVWWDSTDPADPSDPGNDYLIYIEEGGGLVHSPRKDRLWTYITKKLGDKTEKELEKIKDFIDNL